MYNAEHAMKTNNNERGLSLESLQTEYYSNLVQFRIILKWMVSNFMIFSRLAPRGQTLV